MVICGQNLGGNWRNAEIMVDADFPEIIYEADFPQTASCGSREPEKEQRGLLAKIQT